MTAIPLDAPLLLRAGARIRARRPWALIAVLAYCGGLVSITMTVALPLLPDLPDEFGVSVGAASWVATSSLLAGAVANPVLGRLGDLYGKRPTLLLALLALLAGSVVAALASSLAILVLGRTLQGLGFGAIPLGISIARDELPAERVNGGIALVSATMGIGGGLGLPLAGFALDAFSWHGLFWMSAGLSVIGLAATALIIPAPIERRTGTFDLLGAVWLSVVLVAFLLPVSKSDTWGWLQPLPLTLLTASLVGGVGWYRYERTKRYPLVDVGVMKRRPLMLVNLAGLFMGIAMFSNFYVSLVQVQLTDAVEYGFGASVQEAGWVLLPGALAMMAMSPVSARISDTKGPRTSLLVGALVVGLGYIVRPFLLSSVWALAVGVVIVNCGVGIAYGAMPAIVMENVPSEQTATANAVNSLLRASGASLSSALTAAIVSSLTVTVAGEELPALSAFNLSYLLSAGAALVAAALTYQLPRRVPAAFAAGSPTVPPIRR